LVRYIELPGEVIGRRGDWRLVQVGADDGLYQLSSGPGFRSWFRVGDGLYTIGRRLYTMPTTDTCNNTTYAEAR
jgi:hypothetical protein